MDYYVFYIFFMFLVSSLSLSCFFPFLQHYHVTGTSTQDLAAGSKLQPTKPQSEFLWVLESMDCFEPL